MMHDMFVPCGLCGKMVNPNAAYYLARRSKTVAAHDDWEYFGVSAVFFACSYAHYMTQLIEIQIQWKDLSAKAFATLPSIEDEAAKE